MASYWHEKFRNDFIPTQEKLELDEVLQEANDAYMGWLGASLMMFNRDPVDASLDELDRIFDGEIRIRAVTKDCYDYAINGRLRLATNSREQEGMTEDWACLAILVLSARPGIEVFSPHVRGRSRGVPSKVEHILFHALIRARLDQATLPAFDEDALPSFLRDDDTGYLTLKEIALLGQMTERAVRNAAQPTAADQLKTRKEKNQTVVDAAEALRWLKGRRGFIATRAE